MSNQSEIPSSKDVHVKNAPKMHPLYSHSRSGRPFLSNADSKDLEENPCSHLQGECSEYSLEHVVSPVARSTTSSSVGEKSTALDCASNVPNFEDNNAYLIRNKSSSGALMKIHPCLEAETSMDSKNSPAIEIKSLDLNGNSGRSSDSLEVPDKQELPLQQPISENEHSASDIVEDDVKVCDICGDAGHEEKLAVCSRCADGAEHTYCMRIMLDKVPEGDWLCEGCELNDNAENQKLNKLGTESGTSSVPCLNEKSSNCGDTFNASLLSNSDTNAPNAEANRATKVVTNLQISSKRHADNFEVTSMTKKQAPERSVGSLGMGSPSKKAALLSRESSMKSMDMGEVKLTHPMPSSGSHSANHAQETAHSIVNSGPDSPRIEARLQSPRGILLKSTSFNTINSKPKVKQLQGLVPQNKKLARESAISGLNKEGLMRTISKSMSFNNASSFHSNANESKFKMQSSVHSRAEDLRCLKPPKEQNLLERKNSAKLDRPLVSPSTAVTSRSLPKADRKNMPHGETILSLSSASKSRDPKAAQPDGKLNTSYKPTVLVSNKGSENAIALAGYSEPKRQSPCLSSDPGVPSLNGMCNSKEQNPYQIGSKDGPLISSSWAVHKRGGNTDVLPQDDLPQSQDFTNPDGKTRDSSSFSRLNQTVSAGGSKSIRCHRCKETGHIAQFCPSGSPCVSSIEPSSARSSREDTNRSNKLKLKDAVREVMSKGTRIDGIHKLPDQSDDLSISSTDLSCEVASRDQLSSSSSCVRNYSSLEGTVDGKESFRSSTADSSITTAIIMKQPAVHPTEAGCDYRGTDSNGISYVTDRTKLNPCMRNLPSQASILADPFRNSSIPEHNYIWQGGFKVQRSGSTPEDCDGIQAHLSTFASPRVLEVADKFPCKLQLEEVTRWSSWPMQFQGSCATEDNIALYFFARDLDSYERNYKNLLENMLKNDLALKGNFDGIELLIFSSNQLPEKSQRWNRLFFLWGVFVGKKTNCSKILSGSQNTHCEGSSVAVPSDQDMPTPAKGDVSVSQKISSMYRHMDNELSTCGVPNVPDAAKSNVSVDLPRLSSFGRASRDLNTKVKPLAKKFLGFHEPNQEAVDGVLPKHTECSILDTHPSINVNQLSTLLDGCSLSRIPISDTQLCSKVEGKNSISLKEVYGDSESRKGIKLQPCVPVPSVQSILNKGKTVPMYSDISNCRQAVFFSSSPHRQDTSSDSSKLQPVSSFVQGAGVGDNRDQERMKDKETLTDTGASLDINTQRRYPSGQEPCSLELRLNRKRLHLQVSDEMPKDMSETVVWGEKTDFMPVDREKESKKIKRCYSELPVRDSSRELNLSDTPLYEIYDPYPKFPGKQKEDCFSKDTIIPGNLKTTERYFFPVVSGPVRDLQSGNSIPLEIISSDEEDLIESDVPSLELALGAKKNSSKQGILPSFLQSMDKKNIQHKSQDPVTDGGDDDMSASLSLSLAFPFPEKEQTGNSKTEQLLPESHHVNTSLLLFGGHT